MVDAEPKNSASEWMRNSFGYLNKCESPPNGLRTSLTDDFVYEDHRRGPSFPNAGAESFTQALETIWDTGAGRPRWTVHRVVAVRGSRLAACRLEVDYGNGWTWESIQVIELDDTLTRLQRAFDVDVDDDDAAIAELDRLHGQYDT